MQIITPTGGVEPAKVDEKFIQAFQLLELQKMAMADSLPEFKKRVVQEKKKLRGQGISDEELPTHLIELERQFQEKLLLQEKEQLIELKIIPNRQEPNEEFDDFYENEIMKDASISDVSKSYKEVEAAIRLVFNAESAEEEDISEIKALNLTSMSAEQFNNFMFYYYCEINRFIFERIQKEVARKAKSREKSSFQSFTQMAQATNLEGSDHEGEEHREKTGIKVSNRKLQIIVDEVPKKDIVQRVLEHLNLRDEKIYDIDMYLQKLSYVFTETYLSEKGQVNIVEAMEQAQLQFVNYILNQESMDYEEFSVNAFQKYDDVNIKLVAQNDPYQLELTEDSLLLDYFTKYVSKNSANIDSDDDQMQSEDTEQTR